MTPRIDTLVFVGFNSRVAALETATGNIVWDWEAPKSKNGNVPLLLINDRQLIVTGTMAWVNETKGFGTGVTSMVSSQGRTAQDSVVASAAEHTAAMTAAGAAVMT